MGSGPSISPTAYLHKAGLALEDNVIQAVSGDVAMDLQVSPQHAELALVCGEWNVVLRQLITELQYVLRVLFRDSSSTCEALLHALGISLATLAMLWGLYIVVNYVGVDII